MGESGKMRYCEVVSRAYANYANYAKFTGRRPAAGPSRSILARGDGRLAECATSVRSDDIDGGAGFRRGQQCARGQADGDDGRRADERVPRIGERGAEGGVRHGCEAGDHAEERGALAGAP